MDFSLFFRSRSAKTRAPDTNFWNFLTDGGPKKSCRLPLARFAHGVLICRLVGFTNSSYRGTKKSRKAFYEGRKTRRAKMRTS